MAGTYYIKKLLLALLLLAVPAIAQNPICADVTFTATGEKQFAVSGQGVSGANFSYRTTGSPATLSLTITAGNAINSTTATPVTKIAAVTTVTSGINIDMGKANGPFRHWYANLATLTGGTSPTVIVTGCFQPNALISLTGSTGVVTGSGTAGTLPKFTGANAIGDSQITDNGTAVDLSGILTSPNVNNVRYASDFAGADAGAKIAAAIADLPATGGTVDALGLEGAQAAASTITISKPVNLLLGATTLSVSGSPGISFASGSVGSSIQGMGRDSVIAFPTANMGIQVADSSVHLSDIHLSITTASSRTGVAMIQATSDSGKLENVWVTGAATIDNGIAVNLVNSTAGLWGFSGVFFNTGGTSWTNMFVLRAASGTIATTHFHDITIQGTTTVTDAAFLFDSGVDTVLASNIEAVPTGTAIKCTDSLATTPPRWVKFVNSALEVGTSNTAVILTASRDFSFIGGIIGTTQTGFILTTAADTKIIGNEFVSIQQSAVTVAAGSTGTTIIGNSFSDTGLQTTNTYDTVGVAANTSYVEVSHNTWVSSTATVPKFAVNFAAGTGTQQHAIANIIPETAIGTGGVSYNSSGTFNQSAFNGSNGQTANNFSAGAFTASTISATGSINSSKIGNGTASGLGAIAAGQSSFAWKDTTQAADAKLWDAVVGVDANTLRLRTVNDAEGDARNWLIVTRAGLELTSAAFGTTVSAPLYATATNCADSAGDAACAAAPAGAFVIDAADTATVVSTTAVTANSQIFLQVDSSLGTRLGVTCNTQDPGTFDIRVTARTAATSFTATVDVGPTSNPLCVNYFIVN